ncbi:hypothetical protein SH2C18_36340 [Clostridium sediminicola]|uniref:hypothetical protein n=1 Tax=Clostridium sediminicola TaxID=3114879 RepID=UPI0031F21159
MKRKKFFRKPIVLIICFLLIKTFVIPNLYSFKNRSNLHKNVYNFLQNKNNRSLAYSSAVKLHDGNPSNTCVYFVSEVLRRNNCEIPNHMSNVGNFIPFLKEKGWIKKTDYKDLKPGDICFSTDKYGSKTGVPSHTYVFMSWVEEGNYDYAYICDNQARDYNDKIYHIRNIAITDKVNGFTKDPFNFFMISPK